MGKLNRSRHRDLEVALRHPLRRVLLDLMFAGEPADVAVLAAIAEVPPGRVRYHLRVLAECGVGAGAGAGESLGDRTT